MRLEKVSASSIRCRRTTMTRKTNKITVANAGGPRQLPTRTRWAVDDQPVRSIVCFVVPAEHRRQGVAQALLTAAVAYARKQGATLVEAYPVDKPARSKDDYMWFGAKSMYDKAGFAEVARRKPHRSIVRIKPP